MNRRPPFAWVFTLGALSLLASCGKEPPLSAGERFVASIGTTDPRVRALDAGGAAGAGAATAATITADQLFAWAELTYPTLFAGTPAGFSGVSYQGKVFAGRAYAGGTYLALANGEAYGLGPYTGNALVNYGSAQGYANLVCGRVDCSGGTGTLNVCTSSATDALRSGSRTAAQYVQTTFGSGASTREYSTETVVDGSATFAGAAAVQVTRTTRDSTGTASADGVEKSFYQAQSSGFVRILGTETGPSISGRTTRVVYDAPVYNAEFGLQAGQSVAKVVNATTTVLINGSAQAPASALATNNHTFETRESIEVQGRTYDACRYREQRTGATGATITWVIAGTGLPVRVESRDAQGAVSQRTELKSGTINGAPISAGQSTLDAASADRFVTDFSYVLPICSASGTGKLINASVGDWVRRAREAQQLARIAAAQRSDRHTLAFGATKPADEVGECGGRLTYTSYANANGVTTATRRWDNYCSKDSDTGETQTLNGSWSFVETTVPKGSSTTVSRYEGSSPDGIAIVNKDAAGKTFGSQVISVIGLVNTHGVPGGSPTATNPDRMQTAEWQMRNQLTGKTYRQTGFTTVTYDTSDGGSSMTLSGRIYRTSGYFDLRTSVPIVSDGDGIYRSGTLTANGANGDAVVITVVQGKTLQGTMTVDGKAVTTAPACVK